MPTISIEDRELRKLDVAFRAFPNITRDELDRWLTRSKTGLQQEWRKRALKRPFPRFNGRYGQSIHPTKNRTSKRGRGAFGASVVAGAPHAIIVEEGRRQGARMPPTSVIRKWLDTRSKRNEITLDVEALSAPRKRTPAGLKKRGKAERRKVALSAAAFLTARAIARQGIKARPLAQQSVQKLTPAIHKELDLAVDRMIRRFLRG